MLYNELHQGGIRALVEYDDTIFDDMVVPATITKDDVIDDILFRHGDQPLFCPEPTVMKYYIKKWSERMLPLWNRFITAASAQYNPIENYDRNELRTEINTGTDGNTRTLNTNTATTGTDTTENQVSAENVSTYSPDDKTVRTPNLNSADTGTVTDAGSFSANSGITSRIHGNIGVTTSQQMLESELTLIPKLDTIRYISDSFQAEFCLAVY